jgi:hypothetical protein
MRKLRVQTPLCHLERSIKDQFPGLLMLVIDCLICEVVLNSNNPQLSI